MYLLREGGVGGGTEADSDEECGHTRSSRPPLMELFQSQEHYIVQSGDRALWCSRRDGTLSTRPATDLLLAWNPICLGLVEGIIGKVQLHADLPWWLLLIRQKSLIGVLPKGHEIYKITKIAVIPLSTAEPQDLELDLCKKHHFGINKPEKISHSPDDSKFLLKTLTQIKSNVSAPNKKKVKPFISPSMQLKCGGLIVGRRQIMRSLASVCSAGRVVCVGGSSSAGLCWVLV
ncbi:unnamed protein product [Staurois parvus]|uniref:Uncharacterized protein n=1 Tax=Staurois parvus TaxID=386267 RepID=A0ABN9HJ19_9NEOB|nr:unnamed protein product [Staurois parvus]